MDAGSHLERRGDENKPEDKGICQGVFISLAVTQ
jgi:hypothetical protein